MEVVRRHLSRVRTRHFVPIAAMGSVVAVALAFNSQPLFSTTENFVLFAETEITLEQGVQISSGDIGSNNTITIKKESLITGDLFADSIILEKDTAINGSASFNTLKAKTGSDILGERISPISLPIAHLPPILSSGSGTEDVTFSGEGNTLAQGDYGNITINKDSTLTLTGDTYNIASLVLKEGATLIYSARATLTLEEEFNTKQQSAILPGASAEFDDLTINYLGKQGSAKAKDKKQGISPINLGRDSFFNFILVAPDATVNIGERSTLRGQILANKIKVGKDSVLSREGFVPVQPQLEDVVVTEDGARFVVNQIIVQLNSNGTLNDAQTIAISVNGSIGGVISSINLYQMLVPTETIEELDTIIQQLEQNPIIKNVSKNVILNLIE